MALVGGMLAPRFLPAEALWFVPLLFLEIRPVAAAIGLLGTPVSRLQRRLIAWFGIRGIGGLYYLMFAIVHGVSVTPLMDPYERVMAGPRGQPAAAATSGLE